MVERSLVSAMEQQQQKDLEDGVRVRFALTEKSNLMQRKCRKREITSRYKSGVTVSAPSSARRCTSPTGGRELAASEVAGDKRAQNPQRRQPSSLPSAVARPEVSNLAEPVSKCSLEMTWHSTSGASDTNNGDSNVQSPIRGRSNYRVSDHMLKSPRTFCKPGDSGSHSGYKGIPERKRTPFHKQSSDQSENARALEKLHSNSKPDQQYRGPRTSTLKLFGSGLSKSLDFMDRPTKASTLLVQGRPVLGNGRALRHAVANRALSQTINEGPILASSAARRTSLDGTLSGSLRGFEPDSVQGFHSGKRNCVMEVANQLRQPSQEAVLSCSDGFNGHSDIASDTDSVSSGGTSGSQEGTVGSCHGPSKGNNSAKRGTTVPARFWQETTNRLRRLSGIHSSLFDSDSSSATGAGEKSSRHSNLVLPGPGITANGVVKSSESSCLVSRSQMISASQQSNFPLKGVSTLSTSTGLSSPTKTRVMPLPPHPMNHYNTRGTYAASGLSFRYDVRKGRAGMSHLEVTQLLRILHNRLLQWHFINAKAEATMHAQNITAEKLLYNVGIKISELRDSVTMKRAQLHQAKHAVKLSSILAGQMDYLEGIALLQQDHSSSVSGTIGSLQAATLRLPVTSGVRVDIQAVKEVLSSAGDIMHSIGSSLCSLFPKVEVMNSLLSELAAVVAQERALLYECGDLLATANALEVEESSLRTHLIQLKQEKFRDLYKSMQNSVSSNN